MAKRSMSQAGPLWILTSMLACACGGGGGGTTADAGAAGDGGGNGDGRAADGRVGDAGPGADAAECPTPVSVSTLGDTCISYGPGSPCDSTCGLPPNGYVCTGGRPDLTGCVRVTADSIVGSTYCCPALACVRVPLQDRDCAAQRPHMMQCPADADGGALASPGPDCQRSNQPLPYPFYCCP